MHQHPDLHKGTAGATQDSQQVLAIVARYFVLESYCRPHRAMHQHCQRTRYHEVCALSQYNCRYEKKEIQATMAVSISAPAHFFRGHGGSYLPKYIAWAEESHRACCRRWQAVTKTGVPLRHDPTTTILEITKQLKTVPIFFISNKNINNRQ